jgi:hypothetical protein
MSYIDDWRQSTFIGCPTKLRLVRHKSWSRPVLMVLIAEDSIMPKITSEGL